MVTPSPCTFRCNLVKSMCVGCGRTTAEIQMWGGMSEGQRQAVASQAKIRLENFQQRPRAQYRVEEENVND
jgi:predicted Fe-S protein YdhL (DUF1289 family)